jgi:hypothetical protein
LDSVVFVFLKLKSRNEDGIFGAFACRYQDLPNISIVEFHLLSDMDDGDSVLTDCNAISKNAVFEEKQPLT